MTRTSGPGATSYAELNEKNAAFCGSMPNPIGCDGSMSSLTIDPGQKNCSAGRPATTFLTGSPSASMANCAEPSMHTRVPPASDERLERGDASLAEAADVLVGQRALAVAVNEPLGGDPRQDDDVEARAQASRAHVGVAQRLEGELGTARAASASSPRLSRRSTAGTARRAPRASEVDAGTLPRAPNTRKPISRARRSTCVRASVTGRTISVPGWYVNPSCDTLPLVHSTRSPAPSSRFAASAPALPRASTR